MIRRIVRAGKSFISVRFKNDDGFSLNSGLYVYYKNENKDKAHVFSVILRDINGNKIKEYKGNQENMEFYCDRMSQLVWRRYGVIVKFDDNGDIEWVNDMRIEDIETIKYNGGD